MVIVHRKFPPSAGRVAGARIQPQDFDLHIITTKLKGQLKKPVDIKPQSPPTPLLKFLSQNLGCSISICMFLAAKIFSYIVTIYFTEGFGLRVRGAI